MIEMGVSLPINLHIVNQNVQCYEYRKCMVKGPLYKHHRKIEAITQNMEHSLHTTP